MKSPMQSSEIVLIVILNNHNIHNILVFNTIIIVLIQLKANNKS